VKRFALSFLLFCISTPLVATPPELMPPSFKQAYDGLIAALSAEQMAEQVQQLDSMLAADAKLTENGEAISRQDWLDRLRVGYVYNARMVVKDVYWSGDRIIVVQKAVPLEKPEPSPCCPTESSFVTTFVIEGSEIASIETSGRMNWIIRNNING
tara:strand:- start:230 stop:694 length:465 start_codon:yes stop_codon:yes gene_type:complete